MTTRADALQAASEQVLRPLRSAARRTAVRIRQGPVRPTSSAGSSSSERRPRSSRNVTRRCEQRRTSRRLAMADHFDPSAILERLDHVGRDRDATNLLDVAASDRLAIGDDGQRLEHCARIPRRLFRIEALEVGRINGALWKRQPEAIAVSSTPRPFQSARSSSSSTRTVSAFSSSLKSRRSSATDNGCSDVSRAASRTTLASCVFIVSRFGAIDTEPNGAARPMTFEVGSR